MQPDLLAPSPADAVAEERGVEPVILNTAHARAMLRRRHAGSEWALLEEVAPKNGGGTRMADAVAVNMWASRGYAIHGFEIKVSRSDWLRELKQPEKAEAVYSYCDYWWIVAPKNIVKDGELPPTWGLLELRAGGLTQLVNAPKLKPKPVTREFFASLMRRATDRLDAAAQDKVRDEMARMREDNQRYVAEEVRRLTRSHEQLREQVDEFSRTTGIDLATPSSYSRLPSIETIKLAQRLQSLESWRGNKALTRLESMAQGLERAAGEVRKLMADTGLTDTPTGSEPNA